MSNVNVNRFQVTNIFIYFSLIMLTYQIIQDQTEPHKELKRMHEVSFLLFPEHGTAALMGYNRES